MATGQSSGDAGGDKDGEDTVRTAWNTVNPTKMDYANVVNQLNASKLVGEASVFKRGTHVPITHMEYFKPNMDAILTQLKSNHRRSGKKSV